MKAVDVAEPASPLIVFSHANGFPAGTYRVLFEAWRAAGWRVEALPRLGHDPAYPVASNWTRLRDELLAFTDRFGDEPVWLVGHSLGGMLGTMAASKRPQRFRGVVSLDAPIIAGWRAHSLRMLKVSGLLPRYPPGKISMRRRHEWPSRDAVHSHFAAKHAFARWDPRVLHDYVAAGFDERDERLVLGFDRDVETRIYNTLPHQLAGVLRRHPLQCPYGFIAGTQSREARQAGLTASKALAGERFEWIEGTHLFPMERPDETAALVLKLLGTMR